MRKVGPEFLLRMLLVSERLTKANYKSRRGKPYGEMRRGSVLRRNMFSERQRYAPNRSKGSEKAIHLAI